MNLFIDTSSLVKLYHYEIESGRIINILSLNNIERIYLADLTKIEFISAIWRKINNREINKEVGLKVIGLFETDFDNYEWININSDIIELSSDLIKKYGISGLRTLDSIQLACATSLDENKVKFLTSDRLLKIFFNKEGLDII